MKIELNRAHYPVTVLGHGRRAGVWVQGCSIGCPGCIATDTWPRDPGRVVDVDRVVDWCRGLPADRVDGVTVSGGEPFEQPEALQGLLAGLRPWADKGGRDLLCYSGYGLAVLRRRFRPVLDLLDVVVPGQYVAARAPGGVWRGSANQPLVPLTPLGRARYAARDDEPATARRLQASVDGDRVWYIGVPLPGDLTAVETALARRGVHRQEASWQL